jgi:starch phosphorylase
MPIPANYFLPSMPEGLEGLSELVLDLRWSWNHQADRLWKQIAPELWARTGNPWLILQNISTARLNTLAADPAFRKTVEDYVASYREAMDRPSWFRETYAESALSVAYFSMEFGLSEALPLYSGGLGILAGDTSARSWISAVLRRSSIHTTIPVSFLSYRFATRMASG